MDYPVLKIRNSDINKQNLIVPLTIAGQKLGVLEAQVDLKYYIEAQQAEYWSTSAIVLGILIMVIYSSF